MIATSTMRDEHATASDPFEQYGDWREEQLQRALDRIDALFDDRPMTHCEAEDLRRVLSSPVPPTPVSLLPVREVRDVE